MRWRRWSSPRPVEIRSRRCGGPVRACGGWRPNCRNRGFTSNGRKWRTCCTSWGTACRPIGKPARAVSIPIAMRSSSISRPPSRLFRRGPAGHFGRYQEERVGRRVQKPGPRMVSTGPAHPRARPRLCRPKLGKAIPYGIYDLTANLGWVSVGIDHDTAAFAVATIRRWWQNLGQPLYPHARELLITADGGGSNGSRSRLWKVSLQALADELGVRIQVCHFPPGTSKWNKIEHRLFSQISTNWRGQPLTSHAVIIELIAHTTTTTGLRVQAELDTGCYPNRHPHYAKAIRRGQFVSG